MKLSQTPIKQAFVLNRLRILFRPSGELTSFLLTLIPPPRYTSLAKNALSLNTPWYVQSDSMYLFMYFLPTLYSVKKATYKSMKNKSTV